MRSVLIFCLFLVNTFARCQYTHYEAIDCLCATADEILLVNVIEDKPDIWWSSLATCFSDTKAAVTETFKVTRFSGAHEVEFRRLMDCVDTLLFPKEKLLKVGQSYIIFLSSSRPVANSHIGQVKYVVSDYILGVQELNDDLYRHLKWWQEQRERLKKK
ncbi:MAG TPA: hypothetical protein VIU12_16180 [Chryseolinea sp.]